MMRQHAHRIGFCLGLAALLLSGCAQESSSPEVTDAFVVQKEGAPKSGLAETSAAAEDADGSRPTTGRPEPRAVKDEANRMPAESEQWVASSGKPQADAVGAERKKKALLDTLGAPGDGSLGAQLAFSPAQEPVARKTRSASKPMAAPGVVGGLGVGGSGSRGAGSAPRRMASTSASSSGIVRGSAPKRIAAPPTQDKNAWFQNTYLAGTGARASLEKAVEAGVMVNGEQVKLEAFTGAYQQDFPLPSNTALAITTRTDRNPIMPGGGSVFLEVGFQAEARETGDRPALNVMLVIDRSGSMRKEGKMDAVRAAAQAVVDQLEARDTLGIVTYSNRAEVVRDSAPVKNPGQVKEEIARIAAGGGTNIYAGLAAGYNALKQVKDAKEGNLVLLLTDGQVTKGIRAQDRFEGLARDAADQDLETTALGMGVNYNETLMMAISRSGGGGYHFINGPQEVGPVITSTIEDLSQSVARGVRLRVELADDVALVRVMGSDQLSAQETKAVKQQERHIDQKVYEELGITQDRKKQDEPGIKMLIPAFRPNGSHVVLMELRVPPGKGTRALATVEVKYKDVLRRKNGKVTQKVKVRYARDKAAAVASTNRGVKKNILGFKTGETLMAASRLVQARDIPAAVKIIDDQMVLMGVAAREWKDEDLARDGALLGRYKDTLVRYGKQGFSSQLAAYLGKSFSYSAYQRLK